MRKRRRSMQACLRDYASTSSRSLTFVHLTEQPTFAMPGFNLLPHTSTMMVPIRLDELFPQGAIAGHRLAIMMGNCFARSI